MVNAALLEILERLSADEQKAMLAVAEYVRLQSARGEKPERVAQALLSELKSEQPRFSTSDEGLSPARLAARRFMRENPELMSLLAQ